MAAVLRAFLGYFLLVFLMRIVGRRPGKQLTPMEFVLIFFSGGLTLTAMVSDEISLTNALCQIVTISCAHYVLAWAKQRSPAVGRFIDGTPLLLLGKGRIQTETLQKMRLHSNDIMAAARDQGLKTLDQIQYAFLERNGEISIIKADGGE